MSNQFAFEPVKIWHVGRMAGSVSKVPAGTIAKPRSCERNGAAPPQVEQKATLKKRASGTLYLTRFDSPRVNRRSSILHSTFVACALLRARRHREQWQ